MKVVEQSVKLGQVEPIRFLLNDTLNYSMCGYTGNRATFDGYLETQMNSLIDVKVRRYKEVCLENCESVHRRLR